MSEAPQAAPWAGGTEEALRADVTAVLKDLLKKHANADSAGWTEATPLKDTGVDSYSIIECIFDLEERYNVNLDFNANDASGRLETIGDFIDLVVAGVAAGKAS